MEDLAEGNNRVTTFTTTKIVHLLCRTAQTFVPGEPVDICYKVHEMVISGYRHSYRKSGKKEVSLQIRVFSEENKEKFARCMDAAN